MRHVRDESAKGRRTVRLPPEAGQALSGKADLTLTWLRTTPGDSKEEETRRDRHTPSLHSSHFTAYLRATLLLKKTEALSLPLSQVRDILHDDDCR